MIENLLIVTRWYYVLSMLHVHVLPQFHSHFSKQTCSITLTQHVTFPFSLCILQLITRHYTNPNTLKCTLLVTLYKNYATGKKVYVYISHGKIIMWLVILFSWYWKERSLIFHIIQFDYIITVVNLIIKVLISNVWLSVSLLCKQQNSILSRLDLLCCLQHYRIVYFVLLNQI